MLCLGSLCPVSLHKNNLRFSLPIHHIPSMTKKPQGLDYVTLIIGRFLVHKCMIESGASSFVMPKQVVDKLGLSYEPLEKGVVQLDG